MLAYNNNQELKYKAVSLAKWHREQDNFIQGEWLQGVCQLPDGSKGQKGCQMGCMAQDETRPIESVSEEYYLDLKYVYLCEGIFEGLSVEESKNFTVDSFDIVPVGFDFNLFWSKWFVSILTKNKEFTTDEKVLKVIDDCIELYRVSFSEVKKEKAKQVKRAAADAAYAAAAAYSAAYAADAAAYAADSAAYAAAYAAYAAADAAYAAADADAAADAAAYSAAKENHYTWMKNEIFRIIKEIK